MELSCCVRSHQQKKVYIWYGRKMWKHVLYMYICIYMYAYIYIYIYKLNVIYHKTLLYLSMHPDLYDCFPNCKVIAQANDHYLFCSVEFCTLSPYFVRCGCETLFSSRAQSSVWLKLMIIYSFSI